MKINKHSFLKILAKHIAKKLKLNSYVSDSSFLLQGLNPVFLAYTPLMTSKGILSNDQINIERMKEELLKFFTLVPILNIPFGDSSIKILKTDCENFLADIERFADIEEEESKVIYLPYSK